MNRRRTAGNPRLVLAAMPPASMPCASILGDGYMFLQKRRGRCSQNMQAIRWHFILICTTALSCAIGPLPRVAPRSERLRRHARPSMR
ncbi:exported hypothetical protein [Cupriavidus taiwanensis]|nr:exported hypothetical protein [Cupriavidus taiwanensis]SOY98726.1 exported hypothetical protein [Cupriavidus taiwanensis]